jgi:hypothetical protein
MKRERKFCDNQGICVEDKGKGTYSCFGHLDEGRVFTCPYSESDIKVMDKWGDKHYRLEIQKNPRPNADGVCRDFKITPGAKKDLIAQVVSELEKS